VATIKDIAKLAGVSVGTVSHVLNGTARVRKETREKVLKAIEELDYHPNSIARSLRRRKTGTIGFIMPALERSLDEPSYLMDFIAGIVDESKQHGFDLLIASESHSDELASYRRMVKSKKIDGCIITCTKKNDERLIYLFQEKIPFVAFGRPHDDLKIPYIDVDGTLGVYKAVRYLLDLKHNRIGFINLPSELVCSEDRLKGYIVALKERGIEIDPRLIIEGKTTRFGGYQAMKKLLDLTPPPTAVMVASDLMALGAMKAIQEAGLVVGKDISIVGFDDIREAAYTNPPLTTVRQPVYKIGSLLCHMLIQLIEGENPESFVITPELIVRDSCAPLNLEK